MELAIQPQDPIDQQDAEGRSALHIAAAGGDANTVEILVKAQANVDIQTEAGETAIFLAADSGHCDVVDLLVRASADVNLVTRDQKSPLTASSIAGNRRVVASLLRAGARAEFSAGQAATPSLVLAAHAGHRSVVQELIGAHCDINLPNSRGLAAINMASRFNKQELLDLLLGAGADCSLPGANGSSFPIAIASSFGHTKIVKSLVTAGINCDQVNHKGEAAIHFAANSGHLETAKLLIRAQADVDAVTKSGFSALWIACHHGQNDIVAVLVEAQADVNAQTAEGVTPLYIAAQHGHHTIVTQLVSAQANVDLATNKGEVPLYIAAAQGHLRVVETLLKSRADPDFQQREGSSPIQVAALHGHRMVADALIRAQADVNAMDIDGVAPILGAAQNGYQSVVQLLIDAGANVNAQTAEEGKTPLFVAAQIGRNEIVDALIKGHADVNRTNIRGSTPLYVAAQNGHRRTVELLLRARADATRPNISLRTPQQIALESGHYEVAKLLAEATSKSSIASGLSVDPNHFEFLCLHGKTQAALDLLDGGGRPSWLISVRCEELLGECIQLQEQLNHMRSAAQKPERLIAETGEELSLRLNSAMSRSGFKQSRASVQSAVADVLQQITRRLFGVEEIFVVGSFSEGWGNSLVRLDGTTDADSDIDVTQFFQSNHFHIKGKCQCNAVDPDTTLEYANGHMEWRGLPACPANPLRGSSLKPAVDSVRVHRCCAYPTIHMLQEECWSTNVSPQVLQSLRQELITSSCHLATAAPPGAEGNFLRVSTTFLERRLMRSLTDVQGQVFILLKYLIKKIISARVDGLKSYHAKTIIFYMLEEQPSVVWEPRNLVALIRRALQMLLRHLKDRGTAGNECMRHFFMRDAIVYLKKGGEKAQTAQVVTETINKLDNLLQQFLGTLRPLKTNLFYFHPFLTIPGLSFEILPVKKVSASSGQLEYHEIYTMVTSLLHQLSQETDASSAQSLTADLDRIPDCAFSARECLRVMASLKQGMSSEACEILKNSLGHWGVSRGMSFEFSESIAEEVSPRIVDQVWQHLKGTDSAWKFFFWSKKRPELDFLPLVMRRIFPLQMRNYRTYFYINFDALLRCLRHELLERGEQRQETRRWVEDLLQSNSMDPQELLVGLEYCSKDVDVDQVVRLIQSHADIIEEYPELRLATDMLMQQLTGLKEAAALRTLTNMKEELQRSLLSLAEPAA